MATATPSLGRAHGRSARCRRRDASLDAGRVGRAAWPRRRRPVTHSVEALATYAWNSGSPLPRRGPRPRSRRSRSGVDHASSSLVAVAVEPVEHALLAARPVRPSSDSMMSLGDAARSWGAAGACARHRRAATAAAAGDRDGDRDGGGNSQCMEARGTALPVHQTRPRRPLNVWPVGLASSLLPDPMTTQSTTDAPRHRPPATTVLLVRHGQTETTGNVLPGRAPGLHLADTGRAHRPSRRPSDRRAGRRSTASTRHRSSGPGRRPAPIAAALGSRPRSTRDCSSATSASGPARVLRR